MVKEVLSVVLRKAQYGEAIVIRQFLLSFCLVTASVVSVFGTVSPAAAGDERYVQQATMLRDQIFSGLKTCGLSLVPIQSHPLPRPQTPADIAILNRQGNLIAYYDFTVAGAVTYDFKNPNGGMVHRLYADDFGFRAQTPYQGVMARAFYNYSIPSGYIYHYYCGHANNTPLREDQFLGCLKGEFVDLVVGQLCR